MVSKMVSRKISSLLLRQPISTSDGFSTLDIGESPDAILRSLTAMGFHSHSATASGSSPAFTPLHWRMSIELWVMSVFRVV